MPKRAEAPAPLVEHRRYRGQPDGHQHRYHQLLFGLAGATELEIDGHVYRVDARTGLIVPAGSHHEFLGFDGNLQLVADFPARSAAACARWRRGAPPRPRTVRMPTGSLPRHWPRRWPEAWACRPASMSSR
ncbi:hypothetical protein D9M69_321110 [compost metagenome]